jgi:murein DD-endopeptidase MepM/ murein hydrolase activator NlpD
LEYPLIRRLSPKDVVFRQISDTIAQAYQAESNSGGYPDLFLCTWRAVGGEDLMAVAARLSLPYETLATLNGIGRPRPFNAGETVLIPSVAGVFVPDIARNDLDILLLARSVEPGLARQRLVVDRNGVNTAFTFYPGSRLYQTERSFFLNIGFRMPLPEGVLTSGYGRRISPIDGHDRMHEGVDLAAPSGTEVLAAREGTVSAVGEDPSLGLIVIVDHEGGLRTVYGHLSRIFVVLNETVRSGTILGAVGSTGLSTGPHLHFEIRLSGKARDPSSYLPGLKP